MKSLKGLTVDEVGVKDKVRNIFYGRNHDTETELIVRQPRRSDRRNHKKSWNMLSPTSLKLYKRQYHQDYYDTKFRCNLDLYDGHVPGFMPLIMELDDRIVGFGDFMFMMGDHYQIHEVPHDQVGASMNLCVIDKYHGLGIGTFYSHISSHIAKYMGAHWGLGYTRIVGGMTNIRARQGWETVRVDHQKGYAAIRVKLFD